MMDFPIPGPVVIGLLIWTVAVVEVTYRGDGPLALPILAVPLLGFVVERGYWGHVSVPFALWWAGEGAIRVYHRVAERRRHLDGELACRWRGAVVAFRDLRRVVRRGRPVRGRRRSRTRVTSTGRPTRCR